MSWPVKLRALSLIVTVGVVLTESVMASLVLGLLLWYFGVASARTLLEFFGALTAASVVTIAVPPHVRPLRFSRNARLTR
jgi:hypothetical protein